MSGLSLDRREFMKIAAGTGAILAVPSIGHVTSTESCGDPSGKVRFQIAWGRRMTHRQSIQGT
jgi:hypothetical protein